MVCKFINSNNNNNCKYNNVKLTIISRKKYIKYAVYQLLIVIVSTIPIFLVYENLVQDKTLSIIATTISGVNLILSLSLSAKDIKEVIVRKFHI